MMRLVIHLAFGLAATAVVVLAVWHERWLPDIGRFLVREDPLQSADVVVPLAGEWSRVSEASRLYGQGYATWFAVTDMRVQDSTDGVHADAMRQLAIAEGVPAHRIVLVPGVAESTYDEIGNIRRFAEQMGWQSIIVVTSPYHTHRTQLMLREAFAPTGVTTVIRPVREHWYAPESWWRSPEGWYATTSEYLKLILYRFGYHELVRRRFAEILLIRCTRGSKIV